MKMPELFKAFVTTVSQICKGFEAEHREVFSAALVRAPAAAMTDCTAIRP
jgi:hypothetical protein